MSRPTEHHWLQLPGQQTQGNKHHDHDGDPKSAGCSQKKHSTTRTRTLSSAKLNKEQSRISITPWPPPPSSTYLPIITPPTTMKTPPFRYQHSPSIQMTPWSFSRKTHLSPKSHLSRLDIQSAALPTTGYSASSMSVLGLTSRSHSAQSLTFQLPPIQSLLPPRRSLGSAINASMSHLRKRCLTVTFRYSVVVDSVVRIHNQTCDENVEVYFRRVAAILPALSEKDICLAGDKTPKKKKQTKKKIKQQKKMSTDVVKVKDKLSALMLKKYIGPSLGALESPGHSEDWIMAAEWLLNTMAHSTDLVSESSDDLNVS